MQEDTRKPLDARHKIGGYDIVRVIGQGGFGIVYEAVNRTTGERVAVKQFYPRAIATWQQGTIVVNRKDDEELVQKVLKRFREEAALQFTFNHPNILMVKNFICADNTGYMITEYIEGDSLADLLEEHGKVFPDEEIFRRTMEPILDALDYVHERLALHRDISPDNIMIDKSGRAILVDFGAAKLDLRLSPSSSSLVQYKPDYAPIEQQVSLVERPEGCYTDIFAMAGTMYRVLVGKPPVRATVRAFATRDPYVPVSEASKVKCSPAVFEAIDRGLMMAVEERPATIAIFKQMLGWQGAPRPSSSKPAPSTEPLQDAPPGTEAIASPIRPVDAGPPPPPLPPRQESRPLPPELRPDDPPPLPVQSKPRWTSYAMVILLLAGIGVLLFQSNSVVPNDTLFTIASSWSTAPQPATGYLPRFENMGIDGGNFPDAPHLRAVSEPALCEAACTARSGCVGYVHNKWEWACYLKQSLSELRLEPSSTSGIRAGQRVPSNSSAPRVIEKLSQTIIGHRYRTSPARSFEACRDICSTEDDCLGFQYVQIQKACWRYDQTDDVSATDRTVQAGVKRQPVPR